MKYSTTSGGTLISIHNNKINGLPILKGVCPRCINYELIQIKDINKKLNIKKLFTEQNEYDEKLKLIENNSKAECNLFKPAGDPRKDKVLQNFIKKELCLRTRKPYPCNNIQIKNKLNNGKVKLSIDLVGAQKAQNKCLPTLNQHLTELSILEARKKNQEEKNKFNLNQNLIFRRNQYLEYMKENEKLIKYRQDLKNMEKSNIISMEQKRLKGWEEREKIAMEENIYKKYKMRKELVKELDEQMKFKRNKSFTQNFQESYNNVYREKEKTEQFGRCLKCLKLFRKNQICPKEEYDLIQNKKKECQNIK